jgi:hypothetical protein
MFIFCSSLHGLAFTTDNANTLDSNTGRHQCNDAIDRKGRSPTKEETKKSHATTAEGRNIERNEPRDQDAGPWQQERLSEPTEST